MALEIVDIINQGLDAIGYRRAIGDIMEGTRASRIALRQFGQTRDELLETKDWPFARRNLVLNLLKAAGVPPYNGGAWSTAYPPPPWLYEYDYPADCITLRYVRGSPATIPALDPQPVLFTLASDAAVLNTNNLASRVILTNQEDAIAVYTAQIIDPSEYDTLFIDALVQSLARKFTVSLAESPELLKEKIAESQQTVELASKNGG